VARYEKLFEKSEIWFAVLFYVGKSILPCVIVHAIVNSTSIFAVEKPLTYQLVTTAVITVIGVGYGVYLLRQNKSAV